MNYNTAREKAISIVEKMTAREKMSQLLYNAPAIERLGINEYNWWNEASHGVARAGVATVFPHAIALAATFDTELVKTVADAVSTEARAKYNKSIEFGDRDIYKGLTYWTPNINIFRDARWGRGQETFGEDPYLTSVMGAAYIKGLQGEGEFLKSAACAKHFAVHSGPEKLRHTFDAKASDKDLWETYLPAFEYAVSTGVAGVMGAYNRTNGEPCCASRRLMGEILFEQWNFNGYFVSDCGAINDISENHHYTENLTEAAALALKNGCHLNCGKAYSHLVDAYEEDLITDEDINEAAVRLYTIRALLGEFEEKLPFADIGYEKLDCLEHKALNLKAAEESLVLLENKDSFLPVGLKDFKKIAVVGPNAMSTLVLEGNYNGHASEYITIADGIRRVFTESEIIVADGSLLCSEQKDSAEGFHYQQSEGQAAASEAGLTVLCLGLDRTVEGEETGYDNDFTDGGDKKTLYLPVTQMRLAEAVCDVCENVVVIVMCGSAVDLGEKVRSHAKAIIHAWYPGALGGLAAAKLLKGEFSPCGKLPVTFYSADSTLPDFCDYSMKGRTYRYITEEPLYPFGYGLGYSNTVYSRFSVESETDTEYKLKVTVKNDGNYEITEKIQVYAKFTDSRTETPNYQLCAVQALNLGVGEEKTVTVNADKHWIMAVDNNGNRILPDGELKLYIGSHQPDKKSCSLCKNECLEIKIK